MTNHTIRHIGLDIDFHHPESDSLRLSHEVEDHYSLDKEKAAIFTEIASGEIFNSQDMLDWYLNQSHKSLAEHLPGRFGADKETSRIAITFPIQFPENTFRMMTQQGAVDIKTLRLAIEVTA